MSGGRDSDGRDSDGYKISKPYVDHSGGRASSRNPDGINSVFPTLWRED